MGDGGAGGGGASFDLISTPAHVSSDGSASTGCY